MTYVDQIDKDHLFEYRKHLMDGGNEGLTADWKLLRINKMVKVTLKLDHGKGPIKNGARVLLLWLRPSFPVPWSPPPTVWEKGRPYS